MTFFNDFFKDISRRILNDEPMMPNYVSIEAVDLMHKLLVKDPTKRLGKGAVINDVMQLKLF